MSFQTMSCHHKNEFFIRTPYSHVDWAQNKKDDEIVPNRILRPNDEESYPDLIS